MAGQPQGLTTMVGISMVTTLVGGQSLVATLKQTKDTLPSSSVICGKWFLLSRPETFQNELPHHPGKAFKLWIALLSLTLDSLAKRNPTVCPMNRSLLTWLYVREESYRAACSPRSLQGTGTL